MKLAILRIQGWQECKQIGAFTMDGVVNWYDLFGISQNVKCALSDPKNPFLAIYPTEIPTQVAKHTYKDVLLYLYL